MARNIDQGTGEPSEEGLDEENFGDLPQEITESYGTGVKEEPGFNIGGRTMRDEAKEYTFTNPDLTGGDIDASWQEAAAVGDEAVGGTVATPDQNVTEDLEKAVGLEMDDRASLRTQDILEQRDDRRWELDPVSSEDYQVRSADDDPERQPE